MGRDGHKANLLFSSSAEVKNARTFVFALPCEVKS
jgi:hypothetical protein